jgi:AraC-like DNA-binding protein
VNQLHESTLAINQLRRVVLDMLVSGYPKLERVAAEIGMTQRTLQRRLAMAGTSYSELVNEARFQLAAELLRDRRVPIASIARVVGFANHSGFSRAFHRRTGITPRQYRSDTSMFIAQAPGESIAASVGIASTSLEQIK